MFVGSHTQELLFTTRVSLQLSCLSTFARSLECDGKSVTGSRLKSVRESSLTPDCTAFHTRWESISQQSLAQWRQTVVRAVIDTHWPSGIMCTRLNGGEKGKPLFIDHRTQMLMRSRFHTSTPTSVVTAHYSASVALYICATDRHPSGYSQKRTMEH